MAITFAEKFVRAYAEHAVKAIAVTVDKQSGVAELSFYGRHSQVDMRAMVMQEEAFHHLGNAVNDLLGIPRQPPPGEAETEDAESRPRVAALTPVGWSST